MHACEGPAAPYMQDCAIFKSCKIETKDRNLVKTAPMHVRSRGLQDK